MRAFALLCAFVCVFGLARRVEASPDAARTKPRLLVFGLAHGDNLDDADARVLIDLLGDALSHDERFSALTENEMRRAADLVATREGTGCEADASSSCMAEIADAMGARFVVGGRVSHLGAEWILSLQLLDTSTLEVVSRATGAVPSRDRLREAIAPAARKLLDFTRDDVGAAPARPLPWLAGTAGALGLVVGTAGAIAGGFVLADASAARDRLGGETDPATASKLRGDVDNGNALGAALLVGGSVVALASGAAGAYGFVALGGLE